MSNRRDDDRKPDKNNNFFNQNPLIVFAIFSIVIVMIFKNFLAPTDGSNGSFGNTQNAVTKNINYYELKDLIKKNQVDYVAIGQTTLRAFSQSGGGKNVYIVKKVAEDSSLIPLLDQQKIPYGGYNETNWLTDRKSVV